MSWTSVAVCWVLVGTRCAAFEEKDMICNDNFCKEYVEEHGCPELSEACRVQNSTHNGVRLPYPDVCNCCTYCITNLGYEEFCSTGSPGTPPPAGICGPRLTCTRNTGRPATCQYMNTPCPKKQKDWDERRKNGCLGMTEVRPKCNEDGEFLPAHCIPGSLCYCLTPEGNRMFGELAFLDPSDEYRMTCGCSLNSWKAAQSVNPEFRKMALTARCNDHGLYDSLQCMMGEVDPICFCVNPVTGEPRLDSNTVPFSELKPGSPACFDPAIHSSERYESDCERALRNSRENSKSSTATSAAGIYDYDEPNCQPDGMFGRVQRLGKEMICVEPSGLPIGAFRAPVDSEQAKTMDCNCARAVYVLNKTGVVELPSCDSRGNFEPLQFHRNQCFCVDNNGDQTIKEVNVDIADRSCPLDCSAFDESCVKRSSS